MDTSTIQVLNHINQQFYENFGDSFSQTRQESWPSWQEFSQKSSRFFEAIKFLDVGAGNGRFLSFLAENHPESFEYSALESSATLLQYIQEIQFPQATLSLQKADLVEALLQSEVPPLLQEKHNITVCLGVLHHIPSQELRSQLFQHLLDSVEESGELWISFWQPKRAGERVPTSLLASQEALSSSELELGDDLIGWKNTSGMRYIHWISQEEETQLIDLARQQGFSCQSWFETTKGERGNRCLFFSQSNVVLLAVPSRMRSIPE